MYRVVPQQKTAQIDLLTFAWYSRVGNCLKKMTEHATGKYATHVTRTQMVKHFNPTIKAINYLRRQELFVLF
jgi:hypothetical protein